MYFWAILRVAVFSYPVGAKSFPILWWWAAGWSQGAKAQQASVVSTPACCSGGSLVRDMRRSAPPCSTLCAATAQWPTARQWFVRFAVRTRRAHCCGTLVAFPKRLVSKRVVSADVLPERKPERGYVRQNHPFGNRPFISQWPFLVLTKGWFPKGWFRRMFPRNENRNEGTFAKTTLLRNRPFISQWTLVAFQTQTQNRSVLATQFVPKERQNLVTLGILLFFPLFSLQFSRKKGQNTQKKFRLPDFAFLVPLKRSVLNRSVFKTQTQLNRKR